MPEPFTRNFRVYAVRGVRPFVFTNLKTGQGVDRIVAFIVGADGLAAPEPALPAI